VKKKEKVKKKTILLSRILKKMMTPVSLALRQMTMKKVSRTTARKVKINCFAKPSKLPRKHNSKKNKHAD
jgi:hypothetical protein